MSQWEHPIVEVDDDDLPLAKYRIYDDNGKVKKGYEKFVTPDGCCFFGCLFDLPEEVPEAELPAKENRATRESEIVALFGDEKVATESAPTPARKSSSKAAAKSATPARQTSTPVETPAPRAPSATKSQSQAKSVSRSRSTSSAKKAASSVSRRSSSKSAAPPAKRSRSNTKVEVKVDKNWTIDALKAFAKEHDILLRGASTKQDILTQIHKQGF